MTTQAPQRPPAENPRPASPTRRDRHGKTPLCQDAAACSSAAHASSRSARPHVRQKGRKLLAPPPLPTRGAAQAKATCSTSAGLVGPWGVVDQVDPSASAVGPVPLGMKHPLRARSLGHRPPDQAAGPQGHDEQSSKVRGKSPPWYWALASAPAHTRQTTTAAKRAHDKPCKARQRTLKLVLQTSRSRSCALWVARSIVCDAESLSRLRPSRNCSIGAKESRTEVATIGRRGRTDPSRCAPNSPAAARPRVPTPTSQVLQLCYRGQCDGREAQRETRAGWGAATANMSLERQRRRIADIATEHASAAAPVTPHLMENIMGRSLMYRCNLLSDE